MGLVQRQTIKYSIINWVGVLIGALSTLFVYPRALEEFGLLRFVLDTSALLYPLMSLGVSSLALRFFPKFEDKASGHHGFLPLLLSWGLVGYGAFSVVIWIFWAQILDFYAARNALFGQYLWLIFPVSLLILLNSILNQYAVNFKRIVIPSLLMDFSQKLAIPLLVIGYWQHIINLPTMMLGIVGYLSLVTVGLIAYIVHLQAWSWKIDFSYFKALRRPMLGYAVFGIIGGLGFLFVSKLDTWTVGTFVNLKSNGVYSIAAFIANIMEVPARAIIGISIPLIVKHWHEDNPKEITILYSKASINLLIAGLLLFGAFWISVDPFFSIVANSEQLQAGKIVILLLGVSKLVDMATGLNNHILNYSSHFRYSYFQIGIPAIIGVAVSFWLVPRWGITGAAIATLCSTSTYNLLSLGFNWYFFGMQPFTRRSLYVVILALLAFTVSWCLPMPGNPLAAIALKSGLFAGLFLARLSRL